MTVAVLLCAVCVGVKRVREVRFLSVKRCISVDKGRPSLADHQAQSYIIYQFLQLFPLLSYHTCRQFLWQSGRTQVLGTWCISSPLHA